MLSSYRIPLILLLITLTTVSGKVQLPACHRIPKVLCCTERVIEKCLSGCIEYVQAKCPHKLELFDKSSNEIVDGGVSNTLDAEVAGPLQPPPVAARPTPQRLQRIDQGIRRAPQGGDYRALNTAYPVTEVSDKDLTSECGVAESRPPYSPCLSRKSVDDLFLSCCRQHVPSSCHSLCTYEHREHVAAELLISAVQQDKCDLQYMSKVLYCANQNRDNRPCCEFLGLNSGDLGVGDKCLRMCNVAKSGSLVESVTKDDLVCLSNWNVAMYCARAGLRTIN
ncbi:hypothetical protein PRIPAC_84501 [Pristionchus pacificus]|uniref:DB domain-containing protein n=1 Tax=Pristionchus pacificus TaxID=54126 RepID=A0A2A6BKJ9_PRIPA|nr:hypothetical protein PRIPAC_84501 [Pristionchus pacificus]|eukprot:PDM66417.1 hypothetical protein PRIPAC_47834 [Pristionchus pacificus]